MRNLMTLLATLFAIVFNSSGLAEDGLVLPGVGSVQPSELVAPEISVAELEQHLRGIQQFIQTPTPSVEVDGETVVYIGETTPAGYDMLAQLAAENPSLHTLNINSLGGEVFWGIKIGELVFDKEWDVHVTGQCFSSCANYIFTAGRKKVIAAESIVGWHGSAMQNEALGARAQQSPEEYFARTLLLAMIEGWSHSGQSGTPPRELLLQQMRQELSYHRARRDTEKRYFEHIGVDEKIAVYGLLSEAHGLAESAGGWTFRIADMARFGVNDVQWLGAGDYPPSNQLPLLGLVLLSVE